MTDNYKHKGLRKQLVAELFQKGITDKNVLDAIQQVPRHLFVDESFMHLAYKDKALPISSGQTISQPYTVAFQTQLLDVKKMHKVLEIGTGSGYQAAVLMEMGAIVYSIERQRELYLQTQALLKNLGYQGYFFYGDGYKGKPTYGPFDRIIITAAAPYIPDTLIEQLKPGGKMVVPVGDAAQEMTLIEKTTTGEIKKSTHGIFLFVPMLKGISSKYI